MSAVEAVRDTEHLTHNRTVPGSSPGGPTIQIQGESPSDARLDGLSVGLNWSDDPVRFLLETGQRVGKAVDLRRRDIDWPAAVAILRETKAGETQHATLSATALEILRTLGAQGDGHVFGWEDGRPWTVSYLTHEFHKAAVDSGVADIQDMTADRRLPAVSCGVEEISTL